MRALEICGDAHSRAFQSFVTMNFVTIAQVSILSCCTGLLVLLEHCSWLMLVSVSAEMALHLTDGCWESWHKGWELDRHLSFPACTSPFQTLVKFSLGKWKWKVEWDGGVCSLFSDHTCFHPRVHQSWGATLAAFLVFSAETAWCDLTVEAELLLQALWCAWGQELNDCWCSFIALVLWVIDTLHELHGWKV